MGIFSRNTKEKRPTGVQGSNGFGFGPYQIVYDKRPMPDPGAPSVAFLSEWLPIEQHSGPTFENGQQNQTIRRPGEMFIALQGFGLQTLGQPGIPAGYFAQQPLTDTASAPGALPIAANPPMGSFNIPAKGAYS